MYSKTVWVDGENRYDIREQDGTVIHANMKFVYVGTGSATAISATNLNKLEDVIEDVHTGNYNYAAATYSSATYSISFATPYTALYTGLMLRIVPSADNTGTCSLKVDSISSASIKKYKSSDLTAGDIIAGQITPLTSDGTNFQLLVPNSPQPAPAIQIYSASDTFTVPLTGVYKVTAIGGGGGAGRHSNSAGYPSAGGGAGGTAIKYCTLTAGNTVTVTIGAGGIWSAFGTAATTGNSGGATAFGAYCSATGGSGGEAGSSGAAAGGNGGVGSNGDINITGGKGGMSSYCGDGSKFGIGGSSYLGGQGAYGAGGGIQNISSTYTADGTGKSGVVMIEWVARE